MHSSFSLSPLKYSTTLFVLVVMFLVFFVSDPVRFLGWFEEQSHTSPSAALVVKEVETGAERLGLMRSADAQKHFFQALRLHETGGRIKADTTKRAEGAGETGELALAPVATEPLVPWDKVAAYFTGLPERLFGGQPKTVNGTATVPVVVGAATLPGAPASLGKNATLPGTEGSLVGNGTLAGNGTAGMHSTPPLSAIPGANATIMAGNATCATENALFAQGNGTLLQGNSTRHLGNGTLPQGNTTAIPPVASLIPLAEGAKGVVLLTGDSMMMEGLGPVLLRFLRGHGGVEVVREAVYSTGLCRADYFDWPAHMKKVVEQHKPHLVIICLGANDGQDIVDANKKRHIAGTETWKVQYRERAKLLLAAAQATGARVIWVGLPIMGKEPHATYIKAVVAEQRAACEETPSCLFIDTWATLAGAKGEFLSFIQGKDKVHTRIRSNDKVHVTEAGGTLLLADIRPTLECMFVRPPAVNGTALNATLPYGNSTMLGANSALPGVNGTAPAITRAVPSPSSVPQGNTRLPAAPGNLPADAAAKAAFDGKSNATGFSAPVSSGRVEKKAARPAKASTAQTSATGKKAGAAKKTKAAPQKGKAPASAKTGLPSPKPAAAKNEQ